MTMTNKDNTTQNIIVKSISNRFYYGWIIVAISALGYFFSGPGQTYFFSLFINHYVAEFGWSRSQISSLYTIATLLSGLMLFFIGRSTDKYGQKRMLIIVAVGLAITCLWNSFIVSLWMLFIGFFLGRLTGQGSMTLVSSTLAHNWFIRKRALAFSLMSVGHIVASAIVPPINTWLISIWSWNNVWRLWSVLLLLIFVPIVILFLHNKPEQLGLKIYNGIKNDNSPEKYTKSFTLRQALKTRSFWGMSYCQLLLPMISTGIVFHFISISETKGLDPMTASIVLSVIAISSLPANLSAGYLLEKIKVHHFSAIISVLIATSLILLFFSTNIFTAMAFGVTIGISLGFQSVTGNTVWPSYYGLNNLASIKSVVFTITVVASALGPLPLGIAYDCLGSYNPALLAFIILPVIGIFMALMSRKPKTPIAS